MRRLLRLLVVAVGVFMVGVHQWRRGFREGMAFGRVAGNAESFADSIRVQLKLAGTFLPQFGDNGYCNNCGRSIMRHSDDWRCPGAKTK